jgi:hypothetical protein
MGPTLDMFIFVQYSNLMATFKAIERNSILRFEFMHLIRLQLVLPSMMQFSVWLFVSSGCGSCSLYGALPQLPQRPQDAAHVART